MTERGEHTYSEITSQPAVWQDALDVFQAQTGALSELWAAAQADEVIFTGCGSTHYLSMVAARLFQHLTGVPARVYPASELVFYPNLLPGKRYLLVTISRSGTTTETVEAAQIFREQTTGKIIGIGCDSASELMQMADLALAVNSAQEESVAQTRSFGSMLVVAQLLAAYLGGQGDAHTLADLPKAGARLIEDYEDLARQLGEDPQIQRFFFLGSDALYGVACEGMLKMKEMSLSYSEAFHVLEFRHGPMSMADDHSLIIGLLGEAAYAHEAQVLSEMAGRGAQVLALAGAHPANWNHPVTLGTDLPAWGRPALYLPVLQLMAYYRAMANEQNPDRPAHLTAVISLSSLR